MTQWIISSTLLTGAVLVLRKISHGRIAPRLQYAIWGLVLVRLLCPVSFFQSGISVQNIQQEALKRPQVQQVYEAVYAPIVPQNWQEPQAPAEPEDQHNQQEQQPSQGTAQTPQAPGAEGISPSPAESEAELPSLRDILMALWWAGMSILGLWMAGSNGLFYLHLRRSRRALAEAEAPIPVYVTNAVEVPCLYGLIRPAVYLTGAVAEDAQQLCYVLTHELTHYRQWDHIWAVLRSVALVLHWYNPLVWAAYRVSRLDGEMACDEGTLKALGEEHRGDYGRTLIGLTVRPRLGNALVMATSLADGKKAIRERIVILMKHPKTAMVSLIALALSCLVLIGCTFTGAKETQETQPPETSVPTEPAATTEPVPETTGPEILVDAQTAAFYTELLSEKPGEDNWLHAALNLLFYSTTLDAEDLTYLFYNGIAQPIDWEDLDEETILELRDQGLSQYYPLVQLPRATLYEVMEQYFRTDMEEWLQSRSLPSEWAYLSEEDCFYFNRGIKYSNRVDYYDPEHRENRDNDHLGVQNIIIRNVVETEYLGGTFLEIYYTLGEETYLHLDQKFEQDGVCPDRVLTLYYTEEEGYWVMANEVEEEAYRWYWKTDDFRLVGGAGDLTEEQFAQVCEWMNQPELWEFQSCYFNDPREIDLDLFLAHMQIWYIDPNYLAIHEVPKEEIRHLATLEDALLTQEQIDRNEPLSFSRIPADIVDDILYQYAGVHLEELAPLDNDGWVRYSAEYDTFYSFPEYAQYHVFGPVGALVKDGYVELYSMWSMMVLRQQADGSYLIESHQPLEFSE